MSMITHSKQSLPLPARVYPAAQTELRMAGRTAESVEGPAQARRLVVLIPSHEVDEARLAQQIWAMASGRGLPVLYLSLGGDGATEPRSRRRLARLSAITRDTRVAVHSELGRGGDWLDALRAVWQPGDLILCHKEQFRVDWGFKREPLADAAVRALGAAVQVLSGFYPAGPDDSLPTARWVGRLIPYILWLIFFGLQALIHQAAAGATYTVLMSICVLAEASLLGWWLYSFSR